MFFLLGMLTVLSAVSCKKDDNGGNNPGNTPRTEVPDEIVGAWEDGSLDFALWENYKQGYWAGRNAVPSREAMVFKKNGEAKFYRYVSLFNFYETLVDCEGTVTFNGDGTFTFYPVKGRKRYYETRDPGRNYDRALNGTELNAPEIAGKRGYEYIGSANPPRIRITVPGSAPYNWYKKF